MKKKSIIAISIAVFVFIASVAFVFADYQCSLLAISEPYDYETTEDCGLFGWGNKVYRAVDSLWGCIDWETGDSYTMLITSLTYSHCDWP